MKEKEIKNINWLKRFGINAIVLYPFVVFADADPDPKIKNHERIHLAQIKEHGWLRFYFNYLREYFVYRLQGYKHHQSYLMISYEREAYSFQHDLAYKRELDKKETPG